MSMVESQLPPGCEALEPFVDAWAITGSANRAERRGTSTPEERLAFYEAAKDQLAPALVYLDSKPLDQFDAAERRLMDMMLSLAHISLAVEIHDDAEPAHASYRGHMRITQTPADR